MDPEEARSRLRTFFDAQAEFFRRPPSVRYTEHVARLSAGNRNRYVRILMFREEDGRPDIDCIDFLVRVAARIQVSMNGRERSGSYTPERGFCFGDTRQHTHAHVYDLLGTALDDGDLLRQIDIKEVL